MSKDYRGNRFGGDRTMYPAICDKCGAACSVPFKPSGDKPVYCSNCFEKTDSREGQYSKQDSGVRRYGNHEPGRAPNYRPTNRYQPQQNQPIQNQNPGFGMQLELLNTKLDQIIALLKPTAQVAPVPTKITTVTEVTAKPKKAAKAKKTEA